MRGSIRRGNVKNYLKIYERYDCDDCDSGFIYTADASNNALASTAYKEALDNLCASCGNRTSAGDSDRNSGIGAYLLFYVGKLTYSLVRQETRGAVRRKRRRSQVRRAAAVKAVMAMAAMRTM